MSRAFPTEVFASYILLTSGIIADRGNAAVRPDFQRARHDRRLRYETPALKEVAFRRRSGQPHLGRNPD